MESEYSTKGWSWGTYKLTDKCILMDIGGKQAFALPFSEISNASCPSKNEVALEFHMDDTASEKGDCLCEIRFQVPNTNEQEDAESNAKKMQADVIQAANIGAFAGEALATFSEINMVIPRGKYSLEFYQTFLRFHGQTHAHKILYRNIKRAFLLTRNDGSISIVVSLALPVPQGNTKYHFIVLQVDKNDEETTKINIPIESLKQQFKGELEPELKGFLFENISKLLKIVANVKIIVQGSFKNKDGKSAIKCTIKQFDGYLFPLENGMIFINKPVVFVRHQDIQYVEFSRAKGNTTRYFDIIIYDKKGESTQFSSIDKDEYSLLTKYIEEKNLKVRNVDEGENKGVFHEKYEEEEEEDEEAESEDSDFQDLGENEKDAMEDAKEEEKLEKE